MPKKTVLETCTDQNAALFCASFWYKLLEHVPRLLVTSPKVHSSEGSLVRKVTGPNSNPNP